MSNNLIEVDGVTKYYGADPALKDVSFSVGRGEIIGIAGPSGSGKTTLLNMISGLSKPSAGSIKISDKDIGKLKPGKELAALVGMIDQQYSIVPELNVINNVLAGNLGNWSLLKSLVSLIYPLEREKVKLMLKDLGIEDKINNKAAHLSGGEQQRVSIARLLIQNPMVVLADEPVSSLDPTRAEDIMQLIKSKLVTENRSVIITLHNTKLIQNYCSRLIGIKEHSVVFDVSSDHINEEMLSELYK